MCDEKTPYVLDPRYKGLKGRIFGLCGQCFNDNDKLAHARAFVNAVWRMQNAG